MIAFATGWVTCPLSSGGGFALWFPRQDPGLTCLLGAQAALDWWPPLPANWYVGPAWLPATLAYSLGSTECHSLLVPALVESAIFSTDKWYCETHASQATWRWSNWSRASAGPTARLTGRWGDTTANRRWKQKCLPGGTRSMHRKSIWQGLSCFDHCPFVPRLGNGRGVPRVDF